MTSTSTHVPPDVSIGYRLEVGTTVTFVCAVIVVSLRMVARSIYAKMSWDDLLMLLALVLALVATVFDYISVNHGLGRHLIYIHKNDAISALYYDLLSQVFCINALSFAKISICLSYLRILKGTRHYVLRVACYLTAFLVFAVNTVVIISLYGQCDPPHKSWNPFLPGKCWAYRTEIALVLLQGAWSAVTDYFLSILPFFLFKDLQVSRSNKIVLCGLMGLGVITGVFATIRTIESGLGLKNGTSDVSYTTVMGLMWAGMERNIAMMIASVPALRPLAGPIANLTSQTMSYLGVRSSKTQHTYEMNNSGNSYENKSQGSSNSAKKSFSTAAVDRSTSLERILPEMAPRDIV
ncbi:hypothetical protein N7451_010979 [Penicillium sp. IBT 35674x]|nr:hypothetical protein N7451_010979 [Penicillium sp. IBT 35674x]